MLRMLALGVTTLGMALGCSGRTALLLEVTVQDEDVRVDQLRFVLSPEVVVEGRDARFVRDEASSVIVDVVGRDLLAEPYRLLLSEDRGAANRTPLLAAVLGLRAGASRPVAFGALPPRSFADGDVQLWRIVLAARSDVAPESTGCLRWDGGTSVDPADRDCDGVGPPADCDDLDPQISPLRRERCANGKDDDCDGAIDEVTDADEDGADSCADCADDDPTAFPGAPELCDGLDNDCDAECDEGLDGDGDGVTTCGTRPATGESCGPKDVPDCNDDDPDIGPDEEDPCDGVDNDCNGSCDSDGDDDPDGDGYTDCGTLASLLAPPGAICGTTSPLLADCNDADVGRHPFEHELCNGRDDSCDGLRLASSPCFGRDGLGCALGSASCDDDSSGGGAAGLGPCVLDGPRVPVEGALCDAFTACDDADAFLCAVADAATWRADCQLAVRLLPVDPARPARFEVCPGASAPLPEVPEVAGCLWTIVGGETQEQLRAGLQATRTSPTAPALASCDGRFAVTALRTPLAFEPDTVTVLYGDLGRPLARAARFRVVPQPTVDGTCPAAPLVCNIVTP